MKVTKMNCKFMKLVSIKKPSRNNQSFAMVFTRMWPSSYNNYQSTWSACVCYTQYPSTEGLSILYRKNKCPFVFGCNKKHFNELETEFQLHCQASRKYPWSLTSYAAETQFSSDTKTDARNPLPFSWETCECNLLASHQQSVMRALS